MDVKTPKWFYSVMFNDKQVEASVSPTSLRGFMTDIAMIFATESGQFTSDDGEILIRLRKRPYDVGGTTMLASDIGEQQANDSLPRDGENAEDFKARLLSYDWPESLIDYQLREFFGISSERVELQIKWSNDSDIIRLIQLSTVNAEYERASTEEYKRLQTYALATYPEDFTKDIVWRIAP